jgi:hypothetical protein
MWLVKFKNEIRSGGAMNSSLIISFLESSFFRVVSQLLACLRGSVSVAILENTALLAFSSFSN